MGRFFPEFDDISVIIQGPLDHNINLVLHSVFKVCPGCEVIVSTWSNSSYLIKDAYLKRIVLIESELLESIYIDPITGVEDNLHRQVYTTMVGLKYSTRKYSLKLRTDCIVLNRNFLHVTETEKHGNSIDYLSNQITVSSLGFVNPLKAPFLGYWSDFFMFGLTSDLRKYWDFNIEYRHKSSYYSLVKSKLYFNNSGLLVAKYGCEQQLALNFFSNIGVHVGLSSKDDFSFKSAYLFEKVGYGIFNLIDYSDSGIELPSRLSSGRYLRDFFSQREFSQIGKYVRNTRTYRRRYVQLCLRKYVLTLFNVSFYKGIALLVIYPILTFFNIKIRVSKK